MQRNITSYSVVISGHSRTDVRPELLNIGKTVVENVYIVLFFILFCRPISIYYFSTRFAVANEIYTFLSKAAFVIVLVLVLIKRNISKGILLNLIAVYLCLTVSTVLGEGNFRRLIMSVYPVLGMSFFITLECSSFRKAKHFVSVISDMFTCLTLINLTLAVFMPRLYGDAYFLGIKNQMSYPLIIGFLFNSINSCLNNKTAKYKFYVFIFMATTLVVFSGSGVVGGVLLAAYMFIPTVKKFLCRISINKFLIIYFIAFIGIVFFSQIILNWGPIRIFIVDILGKNTTLTNRTAIWSTAMDAIKKSPIIGYGIRDSGNLFYIYLTFSWRINVEGNYSAHNQILQTWYEGGIITLLFVTMCIIKCGKIIKNCKNEEVANNIKISIIVTLILVLAEAPGWDTLFILLSTGVAVAFAYDRAIVTNNVNTETMFRRV